MKRISIGGNDRDLDGASPSWISEHVQDLRSQGETVCVTIVIEAGPVNMRLATPGCGPGSGSGRAPNRQEKKLLDLWEKKGLNEDDFDVRELIDFVERVDIL